MVGWLDRAIRLSVVLIGLAIGLASCGVKLPPLPADELLPDKVTDLAYRFTEDGSLEISFKPPTRDIRELGLTDLGGFTIDRAEIKMDADYCPRCPVKYQKRFYLDAVKPPPRKVLAYVTYTFQDRLQAGYVYHYRIFAHDSDKDYHPRRSVQLVIRYDSPPQAPDALTAQVKENLVVLSWSPPQHLVDGRPLDRPAGYHIYRQTGRGPWARLNLDQIWKRTRFRDTQVRNTQVYRYRVRALRYWQRTWLEGPPSKVISAAPADLTPPPPPVKVEAVLTTKGVGLFWSTVGDSDVAGYRIYRRSQEEPKFRRIGPVLVSANSYVDQEVEPGVTYYYRVTSVDKSPAANESKSARDVRILYEP